MASIEIREARKAYGALEVLHGVSIAISDGEFVILVGPSGCGKSTLLRMIAGLEPISAGELKIGGRRMNEVPPRGRDIAMVFQSYALYPHMTVARNMGFPMEIAHRSREERRLPAARRSDEGDELPCTSLEIDVLEHLDSTEALAKVLDCQRGHDEGPTSRRPASGRARSTCRRTGK